METSNLGGIIGGIIGTLGGVVGTYFSIQNTQGPRERHFMIQAAVICWSMLALTGLAAYLWPPVRPWVWIPITAFVVLGVPYVNQRQARLRREEITQGR